MSVEAMTIALHHSRAKGSAKLVLLGIANHEGDGGSWPTVRTLAKYAGCSRSQVQRALTSLEQLGEIKRYVQAGGDHRYQPYERPNRYHVTLRCPHDCDRTSRHRTPADSAVEMDVEPEQLVDVEDTGPAAPMRPGTPPRPCGPAAPMRPDPAAPMRPKPSLEPTTHLPETNVSDRARESAAVWDDPRCPGDWKAATHKLGRHGTCIHCHERPLARVTNITTGEAR